MFSSFLKAFLFIYFLSSFACLSFGEEPSLKGHWEGEVKLPGQKLKFDIDFFYQQDGAWKGDISIPQQNLKDAPLVQISFSEGNVSFQIENIPGEPTFKGKLAEEGNVLTGQLKQGAAVFPFSMERESLQNILAPLKELDSLIEKALEDFLIQGSSVAIVVKGKVVFAKGYGFRDLEKKLPVSSKTLFAIGSSTKAFTTCILGILVDEGLIEWDKPVSHYISDFRLKDEHATHHLTVRDLVTHQSGLPRHDMVWYNSPASRDELLKKLSFLEPVNDLREAFHYQNLMFLTAGILAERVTKKSWEELVSQKILKPLEMNTTNFSVKKSQEGTDFSFPFKEKEQTIKQMPFRDITVIGPAGSINSNAEEMSHWLLMQLNKGEFKEKKIIQPSTLQEMHTAQVVLPTYPAKKEILFSSYGLGWFIDAYRGHYRVHHGGNIDGFSALVTLLPLDDIGVVVLTNKNGTPFPELLTLEILDRLLELESGEWLKKAKSAREKSLASNKKADEKKKLLRKKETTPSHKLADYVGKYEHLGYGIVEITLAEKQLVLHYNKIKIKLRHWHYNVFQGVENAADSTFEELQVLFRANFKGNISALLLPLDLEMEPILFSKKADDKLKDPVYLKTLVGGYELEKKILKIELKGNTLYLYVPGQPPYELEAEGEAEFKLKKYSGFSVFFVKEEQGDIKEIQIRQPNGVFVAKRLAAKKKADE